MPKGHNHKGRSTTTERFVSLPHYMLRSAAWRSLSPVERSIYIELAQLYSGTNNGCLALSARDAAKQVGCSKNTAALAFGALERKGFICCRQQGHFDRKTRHAAEYGLTLYPCDRTGERASKAFMSWRADLEKFVDGPITGTGGPMRGTVQPLTKENYRSRYSI
jgi:DNA-binding transcriptional regulator YhcF (GntR family)